MMEIHDVASYRTMTIPPPEFYVQDILPKQGIMLLFGSPKVGKSFIAKQLGFSIATGDEFLGFPTAQCKTMIAQFEISRRAYQWRLKRMLESYAGLNEGHLFTTSPGQLYLDQDENFNPFALDVRRIAPNVLILDCLQACFGGDENDSKDIGRFIGKIEELKRQNIDNDMAVVIIHHSRKAAGVTSFADVARGQSKLTGWVDTLVYMYKQPGGVQLQFMARQSTGELHNLNIRFTPTGIFERR
jgi:RecA-family ATPase